MAEQVRFLMTIFHALNTPYLLFAVPAFAIVLAGVVEVVQAHLGGNSNL